MEKNLKPKVSIVIPIHDMKGGADFLWKSVNALMDQTFQDFEIVITRQGKMAENTNAGIKRARGEFIKVLYLDDRLAHKDALKEMVAACKGEWLICGTNDNPYPYWTEDIEKGNNKLGSPSALMVRKASAILFDENMSWLLDCDYYKRMHMAWGEPDVLDEVHVNLGKGDHQMTNILTDFDKKLEEEYINEKYDKTS